MPGFDLARERSHDDSRLGPFDVRRLADASDRFAHPSLFPAGGTEAIQRRSRCVGGELQAAGQDQRPVGGRRGNRGARLAGGACQAGGGQRAASRTTNTAELIGSSNRKRNNQAADSDNERDPTDSVLLPARGTGRGPQERRPRVRRQRGGGWRSVRGPEEAEPARDVRTRAPLPDAARHIPRCALRPSGTSK